MNQEMSDGGREQQSFGILKSMPIIVNRPSAPEAVLQKVLSIKSPSNDIPQILPLFSLENQVYGVCISGEVSRSM